MNSLYFGCDLSHCRVTKPLDCSKNVSCLMLNWRTEFPRMDLLATALRRFDWQTLIIFSLKTQCHLWKLLRSNLSVGD